jgi:uncharacterized protein YndB with AHSA1/START domain
MKKWIGIAVAGVAALVAVMAAVGAMLPRDHVASRSATFKRPAEEIFTLISDFQRGPEWRAGLQRVDVVTTAQGRVMVREVGDQGPVGMAVMESVPGQRLVTKIADPDLPFGGSWTYELQPAPGGGTRLTITERGEVKNVLFRFMARFIFGYTATLDRYLRDVGRRFGEDVQPQPGPDSD